MRILMTGASGFVGTCLIPQLNQQGVQVSGISRRAATPSSMNHNALYSHEVLDITPDADWTSLLDNIDAVVHMADGYNGFEHLPASAQDDRAVERMEATLNLAAQAIKHDIPKFIYLSTIKAMCGSWADGVLTENIQPNPTSLYGRLKLTTEQRITALAEGRATRIINLRFPVVFGEKSDGNFTRLLTLADTPIPLPFNGLESRRSMISMTSLTNAISRVVMDQGEQDGIFLVHDEALTIAQLITHLRTGLDRPARLVRAPHLFWKMAETLPKISELTRRFTRPLELDDESFRAAFSWKPPVEMAEALRSTARAYRRKSVSVSSKVA